MVEATDKRQLVMQDLSKEAKINHQTNHQNVYFYQFILDISFSKTACTVNTQHVRKGGPDVLFVHEILSLHAIPDKLSKMRCMMNKNYQQNVLVLTGKGYSHSLFISNKVVLGPLAKSAGAIVYAHPCAKKIVELTTLIYCSEEVPIKKIVK